MLRRLAWPQSSRSGAQIMYRLLALLVAVPGEQCFHVVGETWAPPPPPAAGRSGTSPQN